MIKVLVAENDLEVSESIKLNLNSRGYETCIVLDGEEVLKEIEKTVFDIIILNVMIPKVDGFTLFEKIKPLKIPVIFIADKTSVYDIVYGLELGAYDYIIKPLEGIEVLARVENILKHYVNRSEVIAFHNLQINLEEMVVMKDGKIVELTPKEFELLVFMAKNKNIALTRERILESIWGYTSVCETRTIDNHIQKLRRKLELKDKIKTVFKLGYRLEI